MINHSEKVVLLLTLLIMVCFVPANSSANVDPLKIGILPDTQGSGASVSVHPMRAVLNKLHQLDVDIVIPVGDLSNYGTPDEYEQWIEVAKVFKDEGMEFLPLMGNHETAWGSDVEWIEYMKDFFPKDAIHMSGVEYGNYYVIRENVLIILLKHGHLSPAFEWVKNVIESNRLKADHIIIASHDGLVGSKNGQTKGMLSSKGTDLLFNHWDEIRAFYSKHDIIWVQGHDHIYQRSVIAAPVWVNPSSWSKSDGNYRLHQFTQIISGNASYKGYEFRYGEREKIQDIIQMRTNTMKNGSVVLDVNASIFEFQNNLIDYKSYVATHTISDNQEGPKELANPEWVLFDQFSRSNNRCERIVYPNSIPPEIRTASILEPRFHTNDCFADDGSVAKILDGKNNTFNRFDSTTEVFGWNEGFSRAENIRDLARLLYQYMFQFHQPWSPNLNGNQRLILDEENNQIIIPETTIDLKKHLTLNWIPKTSETISDIIIVSGTQNHTGIYTNAFGMIKDIETDRGFDGSQPDGTAKEPIVLAENATKDWNLENAVSDQYVLQFTNAEYISDHVIPGYYDDNTWIPFTSTECILSGSYSYVIQNDLHSKLKNNCKNNSIVGFENGNWWVILESDVKMALIEYKN